MPRFPRASPVATAPKAHLRRAVHPFATTDSSVRTRRPRRYSWTGAVQRHSIAQNLATRGRARLSPPDQRTSYPPL